MVAKAISRLTGDSAANIAINSSSAAFEGEASDDANVGVAERVSGDRLIGLLWAMMREYRGSKSHWFGCTHVPRVRPC